MTEPKICLIASTPPAPALNKGADRRSDLTWGVRPGGPTSFGDGSDREVHLLANLLEEGKTFKALQMNLISPGTKALLEKNMRRSKQGTFDL